MIFFPFIYLQVSQISVNTKECFRQPRGKLAAILRSVTSLGKLVSLCSAIFTSLFGTILLITFHTLCRHNPALARAAGRIMVCNGPLLHSLWAAEATPWGSPVHPRSRQRHFPPRRLPSDVTSTSQCRRERHGCVPSSRSRFHHC